MNAADVFIKVQKQFSPTCLSALSGHSVLFSSVTTRGRKRGEHTILNVTEKSINTGLLPSFY